MRDKASLSCPISPASATPHSSPLPPVNSDVDQESIPDPPTVIPAEAGIHSSEIIAYISAIHPLPSPKYRTRGKRLRPGAGACLCFFLPLSLNGPKGEGDQGGEGSLLTHPSFPRSRESIPPEQSPTSQQSTRHSPVGVPLVGTLHATHLPPISTKLGGCTCA